jgi:peroxiredoxin
MKTIFLSLLMGVSLLSVRAQSPLPEFSFESMDGKAFTLENLDQTRSVLLMRFDPYCDHCDQQAEWIAEAADQFENIQLVFVSYLDEQEAIEAFRERHFGESGLTELYFLRDPNYQFEEFFGYTDDSLNIYLYQPGKKKLKYFGEEQAADILLTFL